MAASSSLCNKCPYYLMNEFKGAEDKNSIRSSRSGSAFFNCMATTSTDKLSAMALENNSLHQGLPVSTVF
jgi:hypothetical protein